MKNKNQLVHKIKITFSQNWLYYIMVLPGLIYLLINSYLPMFGIIIAFKKMDFSKGIFGSEWNGLNNFRFLFATNDAWIITRNTIAYSIIFFIVGTFMAILFAVCLNEVTNKISAKLYQTISLLPYLMSWVIVSYLAFAFLSSESGFINKSILPILGIDSISWYHEKDYWPFILTFVSTWKGVGYSMILYYSNILGINQDYFEAAKIDGASKLRQIRYITLPLLKPTVITLLILNLGSIFRSDFGLFYQVTKNSGPLYPYTRTIDVYIYQALMKNADYGMSSAASVCQSIIGFVLIISANKFLRKYQASSALF